MAVNIFGSGNHDLYDVGRDLDLNNNTIKNVKYPSDDTDVVTKQYADNADNLRILKSGDTMTGDLVLNIGESTVRQLGCNDLTAGKSFNLLLGSANDQLVCTPENKTHLNTTNGFHIKCNNNPVATFGLTSADCRTQFYQDIVLNNKFVAGLRNPNSAQDASTKQYTDTNDSLRVLKTGDTMTGNLFFDARTTSIEIGCKALGSEKYFRIYLGGEANKINIFNNNIDIFAGSTMNVSAGTTLNIIVVGSEEVVFNKPLSMANNKITNLTTPISPLDASNKRYVDAKYEILSNRLLDLERRDDRREGS